MIVRGQSELQFSIVPSGQDQLAELQDLIDQASAQWLATGKTRQSILRFGLGSLMLSAAPRWGSGIVYLGERCVLRPLWSPAVGDADLRTNNLSFGQGDLNPARLSTTLTSGLAPPGATWFGAGARVVSVAAVQGAAAGDYFVIGGHEAGTGEVPGGARGAKVDSEEMLRVGAVATGKITPRWPTQQYHDVGAGGGGGTTPRYVQAVTPLQDVLFEGLTWDASQGTIAVGLRLDRALRATVRGCTFRGFSRAAVECFGGTDVTLQDVLVDGEVSGGVLWTSVINGRILNHATSKDAPRAHANGLKRAAIMWQSDCIDVQAKGFSIRHVTQGIAVNGAKKFAISGGTIDDCDIRDQVVGGGGAGTFGALRGVGIDTGNGEGDWDEYVASGIIENVTASNLRSASTANPTTNAADVIEFGICLHDCHQIEVSDVLLSNQGLSDQTTIDGDANYRTFGFGFQDCYVSLNGCVAKGVQFGYAVRYSLGVRLANCRYVPAPGSGPSSNIALWLNVGGPQLEISNFDGGGGAYMWFSNLYESESLPYELKLTGSLTLNDRTSDGPLWIARNDAGALSHGSVVAIDPSPLVPGRSLMVPDAASVGMGVVCGFSNGTFWPVKLLPSGDVVDILVNGALDANELVEWAIGSTVAVPGAAVTAKTLGRALDEKGPGISLARVQSI